MHANNASCLRSASHSTAAVPVDVTVAYHYPIVIRPGLLNDIHDLVRVSFPGARVAVLTDETVSELYGEAVLERLRAANIHATQIVVPAGEPSKSLDAYTDVLAEMFRTGFDRRGLLLNLGGGVINDLGGFVAATYMRGIAYINVPTTVLAQVDSAIGGKVAVNVPKAKNFVGAFHHPRAVWSDPSVLRTLPRRDVASGIAEAIKVAIIGSEELFRFLEREHAAILERCDPAVLAEVVHRSSRLKVELLAADPYEKDLRRVLNLGHTFAHPLEVELGYGRIQHGEAVAHGIALAAMIAFRRGILSEANLQRILALLAAYDLPPPVEAQSLIDACARFDAIRLVRANKLNYVLPVRIGECVIVPELEQPEIVGALEALIALPAPSDAKAAAAR